MRTGPAPAWRPCHALAPSRHAIRGRNSCCSSVWADAARPGAAPPCGAPSLGRRRALCPSSPALVLGWAHTGPPCRARDLVYGHKPITVDQDLEHCSSAAPAPGACNGCRWRGSVGPNRLGSGARCPAIISKLPWGQRIRQAVGLEETPEAAWESACAMHEQGACTCGLAPRPPSLFPKL